MPSWWGKSSSKDVKKKTRKENFVNTLHRFMSLTDQKDDARSERSQKCNISLGREPQSRVESRAESRSTSAQVSRCQSFADRPPDPQPLPLPRVHSDIPRIQSRAVVVKPILEKRGRPQLFLPLPASDCDSRGPHAMEIDVDLGTALFYRNCSNDNDDQADSQLQSPVGIDAATVNKDIAHRPFSLAQKNLPPIDIQKSSRVMVKSANSLVNNQIISTSPKQGPPTKEIPQYGPLGSAPDSLMSSPSRSPMRVVHPEQIPTSAFWATKPNPDGNFLGSAQCSSPGSGQTSGHNSMGGDISGHLFCLHSRGSTECSPVLSPRMTSPGPNSRIHSGSVSPLHPRAGGALESPTSLVDEGRKQSHRLPLPPIKVSHCSPFPLPSSTSNSPRSVPRSPGRIDNPISPGSRWKKGKLIGQGTFGHVYVGFNSENGEMCAMKEVTLFSDDAKSRESAKQLGQEISLLSRLRHPNIVQYYGSETVDDKLYIYLEYVSGGSIHKLLQEYGQFGEVAVRNYTKQILSGLAYLHAKNTVHRDIKGANILVDPNGRVKLADFGMAKHITGQSCPLSFKGSPYWMAPEVIKNANGCNLAVDIWSLGCTILEMATSKPPWSQYEGIAAMFKIGNSRELPAIPGHLSEDGKDFIRRCLQREPSYRPTAAELLQHPFVKNSAPVDRSFPSPETLELRTSDPCTATYKGFGHVRNLSSLEVDVTGKHQLRGAKSTTLTSDGRAWNLSCPVSPIGSPLLGSRSPQHIDGRLSPSPISSPRTTSGASTPLAGGNGAIPYNQPKHMAYIHEGSTSVLRSSNNQSNTSSTYHDPSLTLLRQMQQDSLTFGKLVSSDVPHIQYGRKLNKGFRGGHDSKAI
ncbi:uncharacterized protein A4U43_C07F20980 [Asparagus officinalis]|uniref:mitogen-activated protein kinase kinase kinase n=1 Tax=Asparagus officinalis TaxID=4686 RepID=A0A5P1EIT8_ASPOF|nr:mitogen-activated protein kinase kinase kinase YODA-like [Asparagus officinalis]ONK63990.1 uncharacterized protein A4U43_C07F20980 [Asparagus officinalis]